jgi:hypothetical protein
MLRPGYNSHPTDDPATLSRRTTSLSPTTSTTALPTDPSSSSSRQPSRTKSDPPASFLDSVFGGMMRDSKQHGLSSDSGKNKSSFFGREGTLFGEPDSRPPHPPPPELASSPSRTRARARAARVSLLSRPLDASRPRSSLRRGCSTLPILHLKGMLVLLAPRIDPLTPRPLACLPPRTRRSRTRSRLPTAPDRLLLAPPPHPLLHRLVAVRLARRLGRPRPARFHAGPPALVARLPQRLALGPGAVPLLPDLRARGRGR